MTPLISDKLMNERILKTFHEIRPSFSRVFGGFHDWTKDAMNHFAEYYNKTFAKTVRYIYGSGAVLHLMKRKAKWKSL